MNAPGHEPFDVYCDSVQITVTPYDVLLLLQQNKPDVQSEPGGPATVSVHTQQLGVVRMSLEHAKVLTLLMKRHLEAFEERTGCRIPLDPDVIRQIGVSLEEDW